LNPINVAHIAQAAKDAAHPLSCTTSATRDRALRLMASSLRQHETALIAANHLDLEAARVKNTPPATLDRLTLTPARIEGMAAALEEVAALPDPLGIVDGMWTRPNGLRIGRQRLPLGVVGFIYEARPNVTSDAVGLCLKSGNAVVLKGGSEAIHSNRAVVAALRHALDQTAIPSASVGFIDTTDRAAVTDLLGLAGVIDVVIPRGGESLIRFVTEHARMPVIKHDRGVCHIFVDASADIAQAIDIIVNAKCQRPGVCNAAECLLIHHSAAHTALPAIAKALWDHGVTLHACARSLSVLGQQPTHDHPARLTHLTSATDADWGNEYLSLDLAVRVVDDIDEAIAYIRQFGSDHTEAILTRDYAMAERFLAEVHSSTVLVNASTRFADGGELGLGAEIGISTSRLHAYGPMGLRELTTTRFIVYGQGQTRT
jgi:glutamate-5-semialdehyde dehydrogenase